MAALSTYTPLVSYSLASAATSITVTDIPTTYTDLRIVINALAYYASSGTYLTGALQVGSSNTIDTGSNYNSRYMYSDGSTVGSGQQAGTDIRYSLDVMAASTDTGARSTSIIDIMGYSKANNFKTMLIRTNTVQTATATNMLRESVAQWRNSSAAINTIKFTNIDGTNIYAGSTITIYGIANNTAGAKATGGVISSDSEYFYHSFYATSTFTPTQSLSCDYLVVAGGGGGGFNQGGGGGAGGFRTSIGGSPIAATAQAYTITVGAGGTAPATTYVTGGTGGNSTFSTITSDGGGGGGSGASQAGANGGSGGGNRQNFDSNTRATGISGQGNNGGLAVRTGVPVPAGGGGGGGAGAVGGDGTASGASGRGGNGGVGLTSTLNAQGIATYYAGGGGAGGYTNALAGTGGLGGGGDARGDLNVVGIAGTANTGGGGGAGGDSITGGAGGSGVVIIRYAR